MLRRAYRSWASALIVLAGLVLPAAGCGGGNDVILATTTSTQDSGLLDALVPAFEEEAGYNVKVIAVGSGQALEMGQRGDADVLLVHSPKAEQEFMAAGYGSDRRLVMHNDFIIVGPAGDPAGVADAPDALAALRAIAGAGASFVSRGDDSGTHKLELSLWAELGADPSGESWYAQSGQGMGATLQIAGQRDAYTISDRATYLAQRENLDLELLHEGDRRLLNIYHVVLVNPDRFDRVNVEGARALADFLVSREAQALIGDFGVDEFDRPLFVPDAGKVEAELGSP